MRKNPGRPRAVSEMIAERLRTIPPPIDWREIMLDLLRAGWRIKWIAGAINAPPSTVQGWINEGARPEFEYGRALLNPHAAMTEHDQRAATYPSSHHGTTS